jgi:hypothetical protein
MVCSAKMKKGIVIYLNIRMPLKIGTCRFENEKCRCLIVKKQSLVLFVQTFYVFYREFFYTN